MSAVDVTGDEEGDFPDLSHEAKQTQKQSGVNWLLAKI